MATLSKPAIGHPELFKNLERAFDIDPDEDAGLENITIPYDPSKTIIDTKSLSLDVLVRRLEYEEIDLEPEFQRSAGLWNDERMSRLIESILIRIPLPVFYFDASLDSKWLVIDGLQRLSTFKRFIVQKELRLSRLEYLRHLEGKNFAEVPRDLQRRIEETQCTVHLIRPGTPSDVKYNIFRRINTGGLVLTAQEIRHAMNRGGAANQFLRELAALPEFAAATADSVPTERMEDRELVLRFVAFSHTPYREYGKKVRFESVEADENLDLFLTRHMAVINQATALERDEIKATFSRAMVLARAIFGEDAFRKRYDFGNRRNPLNKALFDAWSTLLGGLTATDAIRLRDRSMSLRTAFVTALAKDRLFDQAVSQSTGDPKKVVKRFETIERIIEAALAEDSDAARD